METTTLKEAKISVKKQFSEIKKLRKEVETLGLKPGAINEKIYYDKRNELVQILRRFMYEPFTLLSKEQFFELSDMISRYRPVQPFSFLVSISLRKDKKFL